MLAHLRRNAVAYLALFIALSGTAYAATKLPKNSVGAKQIKKEAVNAAKVKKNGLTGNQINEAKLGQVPSAAQAANAARLDGKEASSFLPVNGRAADAERLDGIDSAIFGNVQTIAGMNFEPRDSEGTDKFYEGTGSISCKGTAEEFSYRVQLPEGARITRLDFRYVDNEAGTNAGLDLRAFDTFDQTGFATETVATTATSGAAAGRRTATAAANNLPAAIVDNSRYSYQVNWSPFICSGNMELVGAAVHYTLPTG